MGTIAYIPRTLADQVLALGPNWPSLIVPFVVLGVRRIVGKRRPGRYPGRPDEAVQARMIIDLLNKTRIFTIFRFSLFFAHIFIGSGKTLVAKTARVGVYRSRIFCTRQPDRSSCLTQRGTTLGRAVAFQRWRKVYMEQGTSEFLRGLGKSHSTLLDRQRGAIIHIVLTVLFFAIISAITFHAV